VTEKANRMTIHLLYPGQETPQAQQGEATAYDSVWAHTNMPTAAPTPLEEVMLSHDKIYVVLAVLLIIWFGLIIFIFRTDRKVDALERTIEESIPDERDDF